MVGSLNCSFVLEFKPTISYTQSANVFKNYLSISFCNSLDFLSSLITLQIKEALHESLRMPK